MPFLISLVSTPIFFYRYTIVGSLAFYVLASSGAVRTGDKRFIPLVTGLVLIFSSVNIFGYYERVDKPEWRAGINYIESNAGAGDVIVLYPWYETEAAVYYAERDDLTIIPLTDEFYLRTPIRGIKNSGWYCATAGWTMWGIQRGRSKEESGRVTMCWIRKNSLTFTYIVSSRKRMNRQA